MKKTLLTMLVSIALASTSLTTAYAEGGEVNSREDIQKLEREAVTEGPEGRQRAGVLSCTIDGGIGLLIGSQKGVNCEFKNANTGDTETYTGSISKLGLDIGITGEQYMRWVVFGPQGADNTDGFAGRYSGVSAGAGLVVAFGANALIG